MFLVNQLSETPTERTVGETGVGEPINLLSTEPLRERRSTVFHEIIEQVDARLSLGLSHDQVVRLESSLFGVLWENGLFNKAKMNRLAGKGKV